MFLKIVLEVGSHFFHSMVPEVSSWVKSKLFSVNNFLKLGNGIRCIFLQYLFFIHVFEL
jgi:hypothetical protein